MTKAEEFLEATREAHAAVIEFSRLSPAEREQWIRNEGVDSAEFYGRLREFAEDVQTLRAMLQGAGGTD